MRVVTVSHPDHPQFDKKVNTVIAEAEENGGSCTVTFFIRQWQIDGQMGAEHIAHILIRDYSSSYT